MDGQRAGGWDRQLGLTLTELLLAASLVAVAAQQLAALPAAVLGAAEQASRFASASQLLQSLAGALRANPGYWASWVGDWTISPGAQTAPDCARADCSAAEWAAASLQDWARQAAARLPLAQGRVSCPAPAPKPCRIELAWGVGPQQLQLELWR